MWQIFDPWLRRYVMLFAVPVPGLLLVYICQTFGLTPSYGTFCNAKLVDCPLGDNIGALVRLAFHDATGNGGANGCIDFVHTGSNNGLQEVVGQLNELYYANNLQDIISKADLYVLAANTAISYASTAPPHRRLSEDVATESTTVHPEVALPHLTIGEVKTEAGPPGPPGPGTLRPTAASTPRPTLTPVARPTFTPTTPPTARPSPAPIAQPTRVPVAAPTAFPTQNPNPNLRLNGPLDPLPYTLNLPFRYGRVDSAVCDDSNALPPATFTWAEIFGLFGGRFGMNIKEVVAIMGGHTVGRAQFAFSGFDGGWTSSQSSFSNAYYKGFANILWNNNNQSAVWVDGGRANIMLTADVELVYNSATNGQGTCNMFQSFAATPRCPLQAQSNAAFQAYANDMSQWFGNFSTAWPKMTEYGFDEVLVNVDSDPFAEVYPAFEGTYAPTIAPTAQANAVAHSLVNSGSSGSAAVFGTCVSIVAFVFGVYCMIKRRGGHNSRNDCKTVPVTTTVTTATIEPPAIIELSSIELAAGVDVSDADLVSITAV
jgi:hypothetical protein